MSRPPFPGARPSAQRRRIDEGFGRGVDHHRAGRLEQAAAAYDEVLARVPDHAPALNMRGLIALQRGDPEGALQGFDEALAIGPATAGVHLNRGNALRAVGRLADAAAAYRSALALDPRMTAAHTNLGNVLRDQGAMDDAAASYRRALEVDPEFFAAAANLAHVLLRSDRPVADVLAAYDRAVAIARRHRLATPDVATCLNALGNLHRREGRDDDAITAYAEACALDADFAEAHANLGHTLAAAARYDDAVAAMGRALALQPANKLHYSGLAILLLRLGRNTEAAEIYRGWHRCDPDDPIAAHMAIALAGDPPPPRAAEDYVRREFDGAAATFDDLLMTKLDYRAPALVAGAIGRIHPIATRVLDVADLGCGTGLCGAELREHARRLVGVDLSPRMLALADARGTYDALVEAELGAYCRDHPAAFDLLVAADVLIYIGDLVDVLAAAYGSLRDGGALVFTVEAGAASDRGYALNAGGRYVHDGDALDRVLRASGFAVRERNGEPLRTELGVAVPGWLVVADKL